MCFIINYIHLSLLLNNYCNTSMFQQLFGNILVIIGGEKRNNYNNKGMSCPLLCVSLREGGGWGCAGICPGRCRVRVKRSSVHHRTHTRSMFLFSGRKQERQGERDGENMPVCLTLLEYSGKLSKWWRVLDSRAVPMPHLCTFAFLQNLDLIRRLLTSVTAGLDLKKCKALYNCFCEALQASV